MMCPHCSHAPVPLRATTCPGCGGATHVPALVRVCAAQTRARWQQVARMRCPGCGQGVSLRVSACPFCQSDLRFRTLAAGLGRPVDQGARRWLAAPPPWGKRSVQMIYLLGSGLVLGAGLRSLSLWDGWSLLFAAALSVPWLAVLLFLVLLSCPRAAVRRFGHNTSGIVKTALGLNLLTGLLGSQAVILRYPKQSLMLTGALLVGWAAVHGVVQGLWPLLHKLGEQLQAQEGRPFDHTGRQGRHGRHQGNR